MNGEWETAVSPNHLSPILAPSPHRDTIAPNTDKTCIFFTLICKEDLFES
ncbi:MAG: hypothetical protein IAF02_07120 [Anaerolineae bacterium]|nr:hypothetical protein [Anaerolineae bacterium]